eukprot:7147067-Pyramimonas_sp.AAC.1
MGSRALGRAQNLQNLQDGVEDSTTESNRPLSARLVAFPKQPSDGKTLTPPCATRQHVQVQWPVGFEGL